MITNPRNLTKGLFLFFLISAAAISCQKGVDVNLNNVSGQPSNSSDSTPAIFTLISSQGSCSISKLNGKYIKGHALTDSNTVEVSIKVASKGKWSMSTGIVEGFEFSGTGYFASTGNQIIKLKGSGTPLASGQFPFPLKTDSSNCNFLVSVELDTTLNLPPAQQKGPTANAGVDQKITLPNNSVTLSGSATDSSGTITTEHWSQISGPNQSVIISPNTYQTFVNNLIAGIYLFEFKVSDNNGASAKDTVQIIINPSIIITPPPSGVDIYVAGLRFVNNLRSGVIWKNGIATALTNGSYETQANGVFVNGTDVYVSGTSLQGSTPKVATLWKNGVATQLTDGSVFAQANAVFVSGSYVYVAGLKSALPTVWVNGSPSLLQYDSGAGALIEDVESIVVDNGNIYVAGAENNVAKLWINGASTSLSNSSNDAHAYCVFVSGSDVYVTGYENNGTKDVAKLWKNGIATSLSNRSDNAFGLSVFVSGTDVYVAGKDGDKAVLWKNGVATTLLTNSVDAAASSVYVTGTDVYVIGHEWSSAKLNVVPRLWKNGVAVPFAAGSDDGYAFSLMVK